MIRRLRVGWRLGRRALLASPAISAIGVGSVALLSATSVVASACGLAVWLPGLLPAIWVALWCALEAVSVGRAADETQLVLQGATVATRFGLICSSTLLLGITGGLAGVAVGGLVAVAGSSSRTCSAPALVDASYSASAVAVAMVLTVLGSYPRWARRNAAAPRGLLPRVLVGLLGLAFIGMTLGASGLTGVPALLALLIAAPVAIGGDALDALVARSRQVRFLGALERARPGIAVGGGIALVWCAARLAGTARDFFLFDLGLLWAELVGGIGVLGVVGVVTPAVSAAIGRTGARSRFAAGEALDRRRAGPLVVLVTYASIAVTVAAVFQTSFEARVQAALADPRYNAPATQLRDDPMIPARMSDVVLIEVGLGLLTVFLVLVMVGVTTLAERSRDAVLVLLGATDRWRAGMASLRAGLLVGVASVTGAVAAVAGCAVGFATYNDGPRLTAGTVHPAVPLVVPLPAVLAVAVGLPLLAAGAAYLGTRLLPVRPMDALATDRSGLVIR